MFVLKCYSNQICLRPRACGRIPVFVLQSTQSSSREKQLHQSCWEESVLPLADWSGGPDGRWIKLNPGSRSPGGWWGVDGSLFLILHRGEPCHQHMCYWHLRRYLSNPLRAVAGRITCDHMWATVPNIRPKDFICRYVVPEKKKVSMSL